MKPGYELNHRYKIIESLGEGGMANVYLAHDLVLDRDVSVKLLRLDLRDDPSTKRRFEREAMAATQLNDPHIVGVYDVGEEHGIQYMVMEYVKGTDLKNYIHDHYPIPLPQVIDIMEQVLSAVQTAHANGIIHRDLKPQNILIDENKNIKITDFGIAMAASQNSMTQTNSLLGSVHYLSPEQARGSIATPQSDIYSLGIILFELLTGQVPFEGETAVSIALKHFRDEIPSVRKFNPQIPQPLENVVYRATAKHPCDRYHDVEAMAADLQTSLDPSRADEPKFVVGQRSSNEETKVLDLDAIKEAANLDETSDEKVDDDTKQLTATRQSRMKRSIQRHPIHKWAVILVLLVVAIGIGTGLYMHRSVSVPDVEGLTAAQAEKKLQANHLRLGKVTEKSSQTVAKNHVVKVAGNQRHAHAGQSIDLVVSRGVKTWKMADYVGDGYSDTADELRDKGFVVKQTKKYSDTVATGKVIKQSVNAGTTINPSQQTVTLTVSAGKKQVTIPSFKGKDVSEVQDFANKHQLQLTTTQKNSTTVATNHVIQQTPKAGSKLTHGDTLTVQIASNSNELRTTNIQINIPFDGNGGKKENRVQVYIRDAYHNLTMEYEDITINQETTINVPFTLRNGQTGAYRVIRNGQTIMSATNITG
ncbi:Stk1 family PASTA domain-containing Ser/Thr kinase [Limosilactobacillus mucosae]|uniref:Stk1 family PASTA domain-containing Ser/Thr kinase n=1 Tax=Limosilactobacillus mucosae TaxID=97478 RepID=UPI0022E7FFFE|nr:Stk1 family PASTA domain-containing Ser/Thr kinase [Limosilactobacillus mucosae]